MLKKTAAVLAAAAGLLFLGAPAYAAFPDPGDGASMINDWNVGPVCFAGVDGGHVHFKPGFLHPRRCHADFDH
jgi:hypothetical protein